MANYNHTKIDINAEKLQGELSASSFSAKISHFEISEDFTLVTSSDLTAPEQAEFTSILDAHASSYPQGDVKKIVMGALDFGKELMIQFATDNVLAGITQAGKTEDVLNFMKPVKDAVDTGSLYLAMAKVDELIATPPPVDLDPFVNIDKLNTFKGKIASYLGV